ncbi:MAG: phosphoribosylformylglycinamidine synthase, partial [Desulfovibrionaceae bacterium]|nr:phosphoribosylformylglycinamidine synthase [Desulfovibrionaceae bacterium]
MPDSLILRRIETRVRPELPDAPGERLPGRIRETLGLELHAVKVVKVFTISGLTEENCRLLLDRAVLHDPVLQEAAPVPFAMGADWVAEVGFRPGVTDNEGRTAEETVTLLFPELRDRIR